MDDIKCNNFKDKDDVYRILVLGEPHIGKSTAIEYYCTGSKRKKGVSTIGCEIHVKEFKFDEESSSTFIEFWDLSGNDYQMNYENIYLEKLFFSDFPSGIIFFFDINKESTLYSLQYFLKWVEPYLREKEIPIFIVANNFDQLKKSKIGKTNMQFGNYLKSIFPGNLRATFSYFSYKNYSDTEKAIDNFLRNSIEKKIDELLTYKSGDYEYISEKLRKQAGEQLNLLRTRLKQIPSKLLSANILSILALLHQKWKY